MNYPRIISSLASKNIPLLLVSPVLMGLLPVTSRAATATGGTKTTCTLKYYPDGVTSYWVMRCDPENVKDMQLTVEFDNSQAQFLAETAKLPFGVTVLPGSVPGQFKVTATSAGNTSGDVDAFEVLFQSTTTPPPVPPGGVPLPPGPPLPLDQVKFCVGGTGTDYITTRDPVTNVLTTIHAAQIGVVSRASTPGVNPLIWDPTGGYNDGVMGGAGTWDTNATPRFDPLPRNPFLGTVFPELLADVAWSNAVNANDLAVFGGNPGTGIVNLSGPVSAGGLRFESSGYTLSGNTLTLAAPAGLVPIIDTGENTATITASINGNFRKQGTGTLSLNSGFYSVPQLTIERGTVRYTRSFDQLFTGLQSALTFAGNGSFEYVDQSLIGNHEQNMGALTFAGGEATVRFTNSIISGSVLRFASLAASARATGNFVIVPGLTFITLPGQPQNQLISPRLFFNGADYAAVGSSVVRALNYASDANTSPVNVANPFTHVKLTGAPAGTIPSIPLRTVNLALASGTFTFAPNATLTLTEGGLLKSTGGSATITHAAGNVTGGITTGGTAELIIRTDTPADSLTVLSPILATTTGGLTKSGAGTLTLGATNSYTGPTTVLAGTLVVNGSVLPASPVTVSPGATLGGTGSVGPISGGGTVSPGLSPGILTAVVLNPSLETDFHMEFTQAVPNYGLASASDNDLLHLLGGFASRMCLDNEVLIDFLVPALTPGDIYKGAFFTDGAIDFTPALQGAAFVVLFNGGDVPDGLGVEFDGFVPQTADFGSGPVSGRVAQFHIAQVAAVPEPGAIGLLLAGFATLYSGRRRQ